MQPSIMIFRVLRNMLQSLQAPVTNKRLRTLISEQLYHGSIRTITEVLSDLKIDSKVYQFDEEDIHLIECPVIAHFKGDENSFIVVVNIQDNQIRYYDPITNKHIIDEKSIFFEKWSGTVLIPFTNEQLGDPDYSKHLKEERQQRLIHTGIYTGNSLFLVLLLIQVICNHSQNSLIWSVLFTVKMIALLVVSQIVKIELGESNKLITKICKTTDCGKVLHTKAAKLFSWLTMGDVGIIYFGSGAFLLIIAPFTDHLVSIVDLLFFLNLFTLPYTLFSISYQRFVLKTWCPFCLTVMGLLWVEFVLGITVQWTAVFPVSNFLVLLVGFAGIAITIGWFILKRLLTATNLTASMRTYVNTVKKDTEVFKAILSNQNPIPDFVSSSEIILGNNGDVNHVVIALISPRNCEEKHIKIK